MNETHLDDYIRKTVIEEMQSYAPPDPEKTWQKIEGTIDLFERLQNAPKKKRKPTARLKIAAVIVTLILTAGIIGFTQTGEAVPFGWVFQGLKKIVGDDFVLVQFKYGEETAPNKSTPPPPESDMEGTITYQTNLTDTSLEELLDLYPGALYYPRSIAEKDLISAQYLQAGDKWIILLDFLVDRHNILFQQEDIVGKGAAGVGYGNDAEVYFRRLEGVEYMVAELRYGIVNVRWTKENKLFELTCNLPVEEALSTAQSVNPY
ncbi:MAG: hypothetical protein GX263_09850 [Firmicutes bacterium]|jgi:hypothetical protein|nr:hypothetical protein [Bacillota bacterium]